MDENRCYSTLAHVSQFLTPSLASLHTLEARRRLRGRDAPSHPRVHATPRAPPDARASSVRGVASDRPEKPHALFRGGDVESRVPIRAFSWSSGTAVRLPGKARAWKNPSIARARRESRGGRSSRVHRDERGPTPTPRESATREETKRRQNASRNVTPASSQSRINISIRRRWRFRRAPRARRCAA